MNLIEQQNMLRDLPDEALTAAMNSSQVPPYLVLTEVNRRKQVRDRYMAQKQKYDAEQPNVAAKTMQDFQNTSAQFNGGDAGGIASALGAAGAGAPDMGIAAAAPGMGAPDAGIDAMAPEGFRDGGAIPGYANGTGAGGVPSNAPSWFADFASQFAPTARDAALAPIAAAEADPYAELRDYYASMTDSMAKDKAEAQAMALITAGLGIAGGKSQNLARNLAGAIPAIQDYQSQIGDINKSGRAIGLEQAKMNAQIAADKQTAAYNAGATARKRQQLIEAGFDPDSEEFKYYLTGIDMPTPAKPAAQTADIENYNFYAAQEKAGGRTPKSFEAWLAEPEKPAAQTPDIENYNFYAAQEKVGGRTPKLFEAWLADQEKPVRKDTVSGYTPDKKTVLGLQDPNTGEITWDAPEGVDPATIVRKTPEQEASDVVLARGEATTKANARAALPGAIETADFAIDTLSNLLPQVKDPATGKMIPNQGFNEQFGSFLGLPVGQLTGAFPGTPKVDFQSYLDTAKGQAFLTAYERLRGSGAITEKEGETATKAIMRLNTNLGPADFEKAVRDLMGVMERGKQRALEMAGETSGATNGTTSTDIPWHF